MKNDTVRVRRVQKILYRIIKVVILTILVSSNCIDIASYVPKRSHRRVTMEKSKNFKMENAEKGKTEFFN